MADNLPAPHEAILRIRFLGERIPVDDVLRRFSAIQFTLSDDAKDEAEEALNELGVPPLQRDGILYRLSKMKAEQYFIQAVTPGSLEILAIVAASTYFLLQKTIGQSVSEGYLSSDLHTKLRDWTSRSINAKLKRVAEKLKKGPFRLDQEVVNIRDGEIIIEVPARKTKDDLPPTYAQLALPPPDKKPTAKKKKNS